MARNLFTDNKPKGTGTGRNLFADEAPVKKPFIPLAIPEQEGLYEGFIKPTIKDIGGGFAEIGRDFSQGINPLETISQTAKGLGLGLVGFADMAYTQTIDAAKQLAGKGEIDWEAVKIAGEARHKIYDYMPTDPGAKTALGIVGVVPQGIKLFFDNLAEPFKEKSPNIYASLKTMGDMGELYAFGKVFKAAGKATLKPKIDFTPRHEGPAPELDPLFAKEGPVPTGQELVPSTAIRMPHEVKMKDITPQPKPQLKLMAPELKAEPVSLPPGQGFKLQGRPSAEARAKIKFRQEVIKAKAKELAETKALPDVQGFELVGKPKGETPKIKPSEIRQAKKTKAFINEGRKKDLERKEGEPAQVRRFGIAPKEMKMAGTLRGRIKQTGGIRTEEFNRMFKDRDPAERDLGKRHGKSFDRLTKELQEDGYLTKSENLRDIFQMDTEALKNRLGMKELSEDQKVAWEKPYEEPPTVAPKPKSIPELAKPEKVPEMKAPEAVKPTTKAKEPWEMTQSEFHELKKSQLLKKAKNNPSLTSRAKSKGFQQTTSMTHQEKIKQALSEGKPIPAEVLKDYPELAKAEFKKLKDGFMSYKFKPDSPEFKRLAELEYIIEGKPKPTLAPKKTEPPLEGVRVKKPWELTKDEHIKVEKKKYAGLDIDSLNKKLRQSILTHHKEVKKALKANKPIPEKVLQDYPLLTAEMKVKKKSITAGSKPAKFAVRKLTEEKGFLEFDFEGLAKRLKKLTKEGREEEAVKIFAKMRDEFLRPVQGNKLDEAAVAYLRDNNFPEYIKSMPTIGDIRPSEVFKYDPEAKTLIAMIPPKGKAAIRESGFHALKKFADAFKGAKDISKRDAMWTDPTRMIQAIDQGYFGGMAQQHILWPTRNTILSKIVWQDIQKVRLSGIQEKYGITSRKKAEAVGDVLEYISFKDRNALADSILKNNDVATFLKGFYLEDKLKIIDAAKEVRSMFDDLITAQNKARVKRKQKEVPYRDNYRPWVRDSNLWSKLYGMGKKTKQIIESPEMPDFIRPNQPFNPRAMAREGGLNGYEKVRNIVRMSADYIETAAKDIFDTNIVHNNKIHSALLRGLGLENSANAVDLWTAEVFAGVNPRITRVAKETLPKPIRTGVLKLRRNLTRAVFPLNWTWNLFIQTSSAGITYARYGNRASIAGLKYFTDRATRQAIQKNAYSSIIKSRWGGSAVYQDVQNSILKMRKLEASKLETAEHFANYLTRAIEDALTGHAVASALSKGKRLGLKDRALWEYASEGGAKTQSMYNYQDVPGLLRAREVGAVAPFQTFAFEVFNTVREINMPGIRRITGKAGAYETLSASSAEGKALMSNRLKVLARWTAAICVTNAVVEKAIGREPWQISSFIPFWNYISGGYESITGNPIANKYSQGAPVPVQYIAEFKKGVRYLLKYGDWKHLRSWAIKYHMFAGVQVNRTIKGVEAATDGKVTDIKGRKRFDVKGDMEKLRSITMGPYKTKAGMEYLERKKKESKPTKYRGFSTIKGL